MRYYKVLTEDGRGTYSDQPWNLPQNGKPGKWMPYIKGDLVVCEIGYHGCSDRQLVRWLGSAIYEMEFKGEVIDHGDKVLGRQARLVRRLDTWTEKSARLFAADCAEHVLPIFEKKQPNDDRPRKAVEAARQFASGEIDRRAWDAAWDAARAAARDAARAATGDAAAAAAGAAAWAAARDAAGAAAWAAAWAAERSAQDRKLTALLNAAETA